MLTLIPPHGNAALKPLLLAGDAEGRPCRHGDDGKLRISDTRLREMFAEGEAIPPEFSRDGVLAILRAHYDGAS